MTLTRRPERRTMVWARVRLPGGETVCFANLHASAGLPREGRPASCSRPRANAVDWSGGDPLVFGGDMNLRPARNPSAVHRAARALRPRRPDRAARDRPHARPRPRGRRAAARLPAEERELPAAGRPAAPALRPRAGHRELRGEIVPFWGKSPMHQFAGTRRGSRWLSVEAAEVRVARRSRAGRSARPRATLLVELDPRQVVVERAASRSRASASSSRPRRPSASAAAKKGGQARGRQQKARKAAKTTARTASRGARSAGVEAKTVAEFREALRKNLIGPMEMVLLTRDRIEEALGEAVERGRMTSADAQSLASGLLDRGRKQTNDVLKDLEGLLDRGRGEIEGRTSGVRKAAGGAVGAARGQASGARSRAVRAASGPLAQADRARRAAGVRAELPDPRRTTT